MGKSVKLTDGSFIDSSAIWDNKKATTQDELNKRTVLYGEPLLTWGEGPELRWYSTTNTVKTVSIKNLVKYGDFSGIIFGRFGVFAFNIRSEGSVDITGAKLTTLCQASSPTGTDALTISYSGDTATITQNNTERLTIFLHSNGLASSSYEISYGT